MIKFQTVLIVLFFVPAIGFAQSNEDPWPDLPVSLNCQLPDATNPILWKKGQQNEKWHICVPVTQKLRDSWDANNFFDDPQVVELCEAIFGGNVEKMEQLIENGVDVNAKGECGMNPLYWAFHLNTDPRPFGCLMRHGADPNIIVDMSDRAEFAHSRQGYSVTNLSVIGRYNRHFKTVFENGGNPNLTNEDSFPFRRAPAFFSLSPTAPDVEERLKMMIAAGADLNKTTPLGVTYLMKHCSISERRSRLALIALEEYEVNHLVSYKIEDSRLMKPTLIGLPLRAIHFLALEEIELGREINHEEHPNFYRLVAKLEELGESMDEAKEDLARWKKWKEEGRMDLIEQEHEQFVKENSKK